MSQDADAHSSPGLEPVAIESGTEDDLPTIVNILNYVITNSYATLTTQPTSVAERLEWFERFSSTGPYRLLVARRGNQVLGYAATAQVFGRRRYRGNDQGLYSPLHSHIAS